MQKEATYNSKKALFWGASLFAFILAVALGTGVMTNALYCWLTGDWALLTGYVASVTGGFTLGAGAIAAAGSATSFSAAAGILAAALGPWGWLILGGTGAAL